MISRRSGTCQIFLRRSGALRHRGLGGTLPFREFPFRLNFSRFTHSFFCPFQLRPFPILPNIFPAPLLFHPISFSPIFHFAQKPSHPTPISPNDHFALFPQGPFPFAQMPFLAPLAIGQGAYVMVRCPLCVRPSVRPSVRALTFSLNTFFSETTYRILMKFHRNVPTMVLFRIS